MRFACNYMKITRTLRMTELYSSTNTKEREQDSQRNNLFFLMKKKCWKSLPIDSRRLCFWDSELLLFCFQATMLFLPHPGPQCSRGISHQCPSVKSLNALQSSRYVVSLSAILLRILCCLPISSVTRWLLPFCVWLWNTLLVSRFWHVMTLPTYSLSSVFFFLSACGQRNRKVCLVVFVLIFAFILNLWEGWLLDWSPDWKPIFFFFLCLLLNQCHQSGIHPSPLWPPCGGCTVLTMPCPTPNRFWQQPSRGWFCFFKFHKQIPETVLVAKSEDQDSK